MEPHRQVGAVIAIASGKLIELIDMGIVVRAGSLGDVMVSTAGSECKRCRFDSHCRHNIFYFHHSHDTGYHGLDRVQAMHCMVIEPTLCIVYGVTACMYVIVSIKRLTIPMGQV